MSSFEAVFHCCGRGSWLVEEDDSLERERALVRVRARARVLPPIDNQLDLDIQVPMLAAVNDSALGM